MMDEASFEVLYQETARPLWSYIYRVSGNPSLADDILQETYYRFLRTPRLQMDRAQTKSYLYRIATNLLHDHHRGQQIEDKASESLHADEADTLRSDPDVTRLFQKLKPQERELLWLAYVEGNEHKEIARMLGLNDKSIRVLLFRARRRLANLLRVGSEGETK